MPIVSRPFSALGAELCFMNLTASRPKGVYPSCPSSPTSVNQTQTRLINASKIGMCTANDLSGIYPSGRLRSDLATMGKHDAVA
jgi:hypothetical protein